MRTHLAATALAALFLSALAPRAAHACGAGGSNAALAVVALGGVVLAAGDTVLLVSDGVHAALDDHPGNVHGAVEMIFAVPTFALGTGVLIAALNDDGGDSHGFAYAFAGGAMALGALMGAHAVWTFATQPETTAPMAQPRGELRIRNAAELRAAAAQAEPPPAPRLPAYQLAVAPTVLSLRDRTGDKVAPGVGALLRF